MTLHDENAEEAPDYRADSSEQARPSDDRRGDDLEGEYSASHVRLGRIHADGQKEAGQRSQAAAEDVGQDVDAGSRKPAQEGGTGVEAKSAQSPAEYGLVDEKPAQSGDPDRDEYRCWEPQKVRSADRQERRGRRVMTFPALMSCDTP